MTTFADVKTSGEVTASAPQTQAESWRHFGIHLTLDGYRGNIAQLNSMERVFEVLDRLPERLDMRKIMTPYVVRCPGNEKKDPGGISGFVMIAESHISIHTFPGRRFVSIDLYTCQDQLDTATAIQAFREAFGLGEVEVQIVERGKRFGELAPLVRTRI